MTGVEEDKARTTYKGYGVELRSWVSEVWAVGGRVRQP